MENSSGTLLLTFVSEDLVSRLSEAECERPRPMVRFWRLACGMCLSESARSRPGSRAREPNSFDLRSDARCRGLPSV